MAETFKNKGLKTKNGDQANQGSNWLHTYFTEASEYSKEDILFFIF